MTLKISKHNVSPKHPSLATGWMGCFMLGAYRVAKRESGSGRKEALSR